MSSWEVSTTSSWKVFQILVLSYHFQTEPKTDSQLTVLCALNPWILYNDRHTTLSCVHLPQLFSSLLSEQCWMPSQSNVQLTQAGNPVLHLNAPSGHIICSAKMSLLNVKFSIIESIRIWPHKLTSSSSPSAQSESPSHTQSHGIHDEFVLEQWNPSSSKFFVSIVNADRRYQCQTISYNFMCCFLK